MTKENTTPENFLGQASIPPSHEEKVLKRTRCEVWTRVMGYHRPATHFNVGKKSEFYSRQFFDEEITANSEFCKKYS